MYHRQYFCRQKKISVLLGDVLKCFERTPSFFVTPLGDLSRPNPVAGQGPNEADEMSASAFLAAVKGRLMEWGKVRWGDGRILLEKWGYDGFIMVDNFVDNL